MSEEMTLSLLDGTHEEAELRRLIRQYARSQEGYDARLYDLWDRWNEEFFEGRMVPSLIQLTDPGQTQCYGCCTTFSGLAGIHSAIKIRRSILDGTLRDLKHGNRNPQGLRRFLEDVLLHEMVHQWHHEVTGETDPPDYRGHGPAFSQKVNEIGARLGLPRVGRTRKKRDTEDKGLELPQHWPHTVRPDGYYLGAHVPSRVDKPPGMFVPFDIQEAIPLLLKHWDVDRLLEDLHEAAVAERVEELRKQRDT
jgi:hypothetical protein